MIYNEKNADVTKQEGYVIAHCISIDCAMGAGVVVPICNKHTMLRTACHSYVYNNYVTPGDIYRYEDNKGVVYNMFTKQYCYQHAGDGMTNEQYLDYLKSALMNIKQSMQTNNETKLAMPRIGCGLDRCDWNEVSEIIKNVFNDTDIEILICIK